jgi:hypothetical protein
MRVGIHREARRRMAEQVRDDLRMHPRLEQSGRFIGPTPRPGGVYHDWHRAAAASEGWGSLRVPPPAAFPRARLGAFDPPRSRSGAAREGAALRVGRARADPLGVAAGRLSVGSCQGREVARIGRLITPPRQRSRTVEASRLSFEREGRQSAVTRLSCKHFLLRRTAQEQTMVRGAVRF